MPLDQFGLPREGHVDLIERPLVPRKPPGRLLRLYAKRLANRPLPAMITDDGQASFLQPAFIDKKIAMWSAPGNATTAPTNFGASALTAVGTATARNVATTNMFTRVRRIGYVSAATAGSAAGVRLTSAQFTVGTGAGLGGFFFSCVFGVSDAAILAAARIFIGLQSSTAAPTDVEPSTLTNCLGIGANSADTNFKIYYGGSSAQTAIDLGANFPCDTTNTDLYRVSFWSSPWENAVIHYEVTRLNIVDSLTGQPVFVATGQLRGTVGTTVPASTTLLTPNFYRSNGGNATAVAFDLSTLYIETEQ